MAQLCVIDACEGVGQVISKFPEHATRMLYDLADFRCRQTGDLVVSGRGGFPHGVLFGGLNLRAFLGS